MIHKRKIMLWLVGIFLCCPGLTFGGEDSINVSPSGEARPGIFDITISGKRDPGEATVLESNYSVQYIGENMLGSAEIQVYATIGKHETIPVPTPELSAPSPLYVAPANPGNTLEDPDNSLYERLFRVYLSGGYYTVVYFVRDSLADAYERVYYDGPDAAYDGRIALKVTAPGVPVNIQNSSFHVEGTDSFIIEDMTVPYAPGCYWGTFQWNRNSFSWELTEGGPMDCE